MNDNFQPIYMAGRQSDESSSASHTVTELARTEFLAFFSRIANGDNRQSKMDNSHTKWSSTINYSDRITKQGIHMKRTQHNRSKWVLVSV